MMVDQQNDPLSAEQRADAHAVYSKVIAAMNERQIGTLPAFAMIGAVLTQVLDDFDKTTAHRMVDEFCKKAHELVDRPTFRRG